VEGELQMKSWTDKDGNVRKSAEIFVDDLKFMGGTRRENTTMNADIAETPAFAQ
jgi:single-stranded DNA-binding protein